MFKAFRFSFEGFFIGEIFLIEVVSQISIDSMLLCNISSECLSSCEDMLIGSGRSRLLIETHFPQAKRAVDTLQFSEHIHHLFLF